MADDDGIAAGALMDRWRQEPYGLDFFQAVRRLESLFPDKPRVGTSKTPEDDYVHFSQHISLGFAPSPLAGFDTDDFDKKRYCMAVNFLGLLGTNGPMPLYISEYVNNRLLHHKDKTLADFLDIFNHRMISLFYRAWASARPCVSLDRDDNRFGFYIATLLGLGEPSSRNRDSISDNAKFYYSGRLICPSKNPEGLKAILQDFFQIPVEIEEFVGQWIDLSSDYQCQLGLNMQAGTLGLNIIVGSQVWICQQKFRIKLGPMSFCDYEQMLPGQKSLKRLHDWVRYYCGNDLEWDVQLFLLASQVPDISLGIAGKLGFTTWLKSRPFERDANDLILKAD